MATTTPNFGWAVPTSTDLVKDGAVAIETLGDSIDASLVDLKGGTTGQVLAKASGTDMDFSWVAQDDSNAIQNALLTTTGDTIYASGASTPARLGIGSTGQVLTVTGGVPAWATPAGGGGKVLQVVATNAGTTSSSTNTYVDHISLSITPSNTSSKVLVLFAAGNASKGSSNAGLQSKLVRGATDILQITTIAAFTGEATDNRVGAIACNYLDSPATTSATTYKIQMNSFYNNASVTINPNDDRSTLVLMEIAG